MRTFDGMLRIPLME